MPSLRLPEAVLMVDEQEIKGPPCARNFGNCRTNRSGKKTPQRRAPRSGVSFSDNYHRTIAESSAEVVEMGRIVDEDCAFAIRLLDTNARSLAREARRWSRLQSGMCGQSVPQSIRSGGRLDEGRAAPCRPRGANRYRWTGGYGPVSFDPHLPRFHRLDKNI